MTDVVGHFLVFTIIGVLFLMAPLLLGALIRPTNPNAEKDSAYECGEPSIGTAYVQFDLRFYVVALLFIIFDVEVAFFFPWAAVYGGATQLMDNRVTGEVRAQLTEKILSLPSGALAGNDAAVLTAESAQRLALTGLTDILVFFGVLLVGFAYVWKRGDLDWVRALSEQARRSVSVSGAAASTGVAPTRKLEPVA